MIGFDSKHLVKSRYVITPALRDGELANLPPALQGQLDPVQWVADHLWITFPGDAELMEVSLSAGDPQGLDRLLKSVIDAYFQQVVESARRQRHERMNELELASVQLETELRTKLTELREFSRRVGSSDVPSTDIELMRMQTNTYQKVLEDLHDEIARTKIELGRERAHERSQLQILSPAFPAQESNSRVRMLATSGAAGATFLLALLVVAVRSRRKS